MWAKHSYSKAQGSRLNQNSTNFGRRVKGFLPPPPPSQPPPPQPPALQPPPQPPPPPSPPPTPPPQPSQPPHSGLSHDFLRTFL